MKLVHLVGFITKKFVTMHGHMSRCMVTCHDARSHERKIVLVVFFVLGTLKIQLDRSSEVKTISEGHGRRGGHSMY